MHRHGHPFITTIIYSSLQAFIHHYNHSCIITIVKESLQVVGHHNILSLSRSLGHRIKHLGNIDLYSSSQPQKGHSKPLRIINIGSPSYTSLGKTCYQIIPHSMRSYIKYFIPISVLSCIWISLDLGENFILTCHYLLANHLTCIKSLAYIKEHKSREFTTIISRIVHQGFSTTTRHDRFYTYLGISCYLGTFHSLRHFIKHQACMDQLTIWGFLFNILQWPLCFT